MNYKIVNGWDWFNSCPLFQVTGINNDYVGEWHKIRSDAENEMSGLT